MGVPKILEDTLVTLSEDHAIRSWNIFFEKNGQVTIKVRFDAIEDSLNRENQELVGWRRKSEQQSLRDRRRSDRWRAARSRDLPNQRPGAGGGPVSPSRQDRPTLDSLDRRITRSQSTRLIEQERSDSESRPVVMTERTPETPTYVCVSDIQNISVFSPECDPSPPSCHPIQPSELSMEPVVCVADIHPPSESPVRTARMRDTDVASDTDSDISTDLGVSVIGCSNFDCAYYAGRGFAPRGQDIFRCDRCSEPKSETCVCSKCLAEGGHARHTKFLTQMTPSDVY